MPAVFSRDATDDPYTTNAQALIPSTAEAWDNVQEVDEGTKSFRAKSNDAAFVEDRLKKNVVPLSAPPNKIRSVFPSLHKYKKSRFQTWHYKLRKNWPYEEPMATATAPAPIPTGTQNILSLWFAYRCATS